ncbi:MAG: polymer-forming cytoskeletal protein [Spirochaetales bacterium]|nr:polymer-forming cytoskeletal protein [Spirochaetales bacterium]
MSDYIGTDGTFINSIIGEGTRFDGDLTLSGLLRIDGDFSGTITTTGKVLIGKNGRARCTIQGDTVVIGGVMKGDIVAAEKVIVLATGMVIGNIVAPRLVAEDGVLLHGSFTISTHRDAAGTPAPVEVYNPFA